MSIFVIHVLLVVIVNVGVVVAVATNAVFLLGPSKVAGVKLSSRLLMRM